MAKSAAQLASDQALLSTRQRAAGQHPSQALRDAQITTAHRPVVVTGMHDPADLGAELAAIAARLRAAADGGLQKDLADGIYNAAQPVTAEIRASLDAYMPNRYAGTLNPDLQLSVHRFLSRSEPGVIIRASNRGAKKRRLRQLNAGVLTHPLFGDRHHWYSQGPGNGGMAAGFFDGPAARTAPQFRVVLERVLANLALKLR